MQNESCENCRYVVGGECRRWPPSVTLLPGGPACGVIQQAGQQAVQILAISRWPPLVPDGWCGEYQPVLARGFDARAKVTDA